ncbi:MAG: hypothetical protein R3C54_01645 [Parvularculaceae bacterium]
MRAAQGGALTLPPDLFYQLMTLHGAGMVGAAGLAGFSVMWFFLNRYVELSRAMFVAFLAVFLIGVVIIIWSIMIAGFGGLGPSCFRCP